MKKTLVVTFAFACLAFRVEAEVVKVNVSTRAEVGTSGYEKIVGTIHFAINPLDPHNAIIVDLDKARANADRRVEFSADSSRRFASLLRSACSQLSQAVSNSAWRTSSRGATTTKNRCDRTESRRCGPTPFSISRASRACEVLAVA